MNTMLKRKKRTIQILSGILLFSLLLSGCSGTEEKRETEDPVPTESQVEEVADVPETTPVPTPVPTPLPTPEPTEVPSVSSSFRIHFLDVAQAEAALVECDGHWMMIDGGRQEDSDRIYSILKKNQVPGLDLVVGGSIAEDHIGGLMGALNYTSPGTILIPGTDPENETLSELIRTAELNGEEITVPERKDRFSLGSSWVTVLGVDSENILLKIEYGNTSFLFTAEAEQEMEQAVLDSGEDLSATVLKVGHHGSATATGSAFLKAVMPEYAVISCGEGNEEGYPAEETLNSLKEAGIPVFRTDMQGEILCESDGETVTFTVEKNRDADTLSSPGIRQERVEETAEPVTEEIQPSEEPERGLTYVLNTNTMKFHYPTCPSVANMKENNKEIFKGDRKELISRGYQPCKRCNP